MIRFFLATLVGGMFAFTASAAGLGPSNYSTPNPEIWQPNHIIKAATTCFKTGEQTSGFNKICMYDCLGSAKAITISSTSLCPLTIKD